jgi:protein-tyrosine sulfotransferase
METLVEGDAEPYAVPYPSLALVVGAARSGTTLLRVLLDCHPEIGCPGEAGIPALIAHLSRVWMTVDGREPSSPNIPAEVRREIASAALAPMRHYCEIHDKRLYVDKSLDSVHLLPIVHDFVPNGRYVLLFRHVLDTVLSGIEASPWGFNAYGYPSYVQANNFVAGLVAYWQDHVAAAIEWESAHSTQCLRVRYEDLVARPAETLAGIHRFLGVEERPELAASALERAASVAGPGDHKVLGTQRVHQESVGRGKRVPINMIPPFLLAATNEALVALGYQALTESWSTMAGEDGGAPERARLVDTFYELLSACCRDRTSPAESFMLVADDCAGASWLVEPREGRVAASGAARARTVAGNVADLMAALTTDTNIPTLARSGRLRYRVAPDGANTGRIDARELVVIFRYLQDGLATSLDRRAASDGSKTLRR